MKKGFSLLETVIALSLVGIIFGLSITVFNVASSERARLEHYRYFSHEVDKYLQVYRLDVPANFYTNVTQCFDDEVEFILKDETNQTYTIKYTASHKKTTADDANASFTLTITIDNGFSARVTGKKGILMTIDNFKSNYDLTKDAEATIQADSKFQLTGEVTL